MESFAVERFTEKVVISLVDKTGEGMWRYLLTMMEVKDWLPGGMFIVNLVDEDGKLIHSAAKYIDLIDGVLVAFELEIGFEDKESRVLEVAIEPSEERYYIRVS